MHSLFWANAVIVLVYGLLMKLTASTTDDLEAILRDAVTDCMHAAHMVPKELAANAGITESHLHHCLNPDRAERLALVHVIKFGFRFWMHFGPVLMLVVFKRRWQELAEEARRVV